MVVLSVGHANVDLTLFVREIPAPDSDVRALATMIGSGGAASNFAIALSRMGEEVAVLAIVGDDLLGELYMRSMREAGVDVSHVKVVRGEITGLVTVINEVGKQRRMISTPGANARMTPDFIEEKREVIESAELVHVASLEVENAEAVARIRKDLSWDPGVKIARLGAERLREVFSSTRRLFVSRVEARVLTGEEDPRSAAEILSSMGPEEVVIKLGREGAASLISGEFMVVEALRPMVVDTTGAGDVFDAAYTVARRRGYSPESSLKLANSAAAIKLSRPGTTRGIPNWDEVVTVACMFYGELK